MQDSHLFYYFLSCLKQFFQTQTVNRAFRTLFRFQPVIQGHCSLLTGTCKIIFIRDISRYLFCRSLPAELSAFVLFPRSPSCEADYSKNGRLKIIVISTGVYLQAGSGSRTCRLRASSPVRVSREQRSRELRADEGNGAREG